MSTALRIRAVLLGSIDYLTSKEFRRVVFGLAKIRINRTIQQKIYSKGGPEWAIKSFINNKTIDMVYGRDASMPPEWKGYKEGKRVIVYHEADKAGPHIDTYLEVDGKAYSIGVKRLRPEHMANITKRNGILTDKSKAYIASIIKSEYENNAWLAQTTDHTPDEARTEWLNRNFNGVYGLGETRQVVMDSPVSIFSTGDSIEFRDWDLNPNSNAYVFRLIAKGPNRSTNILKLGYKKTEDIKFKDRLHLKPHIGTDEFDSFRKMVGDDGIVTVKHDGASFYFESTDKGTRFFSPRVSKVTGQRINYDAKVHNLIHIKSPYKVSGMGELDFINIKTGKPIAAHETGGILNSHAPVPSHLYPRLTIYRIDNLGRVDVHSINYNENLSLIRSFVDGLNDYRIKAPTVVNWNNAKEIAMQHEGLVGIPANKSILDGRKFKPRTDTHDWTIKSIDLYPGPNGRTAGVVRFKSESGKEFKIGASSMGNDQFVNELQSKPGDYIGKVAKIESYGGHEGRASRFVQFHLDKGTG